MTDLRFIEIPKIENEVLFEELCRDLLVSDGKYEPVNMHGRKGQKQDGVDVYARKIDTGEWEAIQSKVRTTNRTFSRDELLVEVNKAKQFNPKISKYYLYTTLDRDANTQELVRVINDELANEGQFSFDVKFWADIEEQLKEEENHPVYFKYYRRFFRDNTSIGHSIGKLMNVELGFGGRPDTHCEIIIGKIPRSNADSKNVDYYRGTYFIVNLHEKRLEFFTPHKVDEPPYCHESDIEIAFPNQVDCYRIVKWINAIENLDDFIYNDIYTDVFHISQEEREEFNKRFSDED